MLFNLLQESVQGIDKALPLFSLQKVAMVSQISFSISEISIVAPSMTCECLTIAV